MQDENTPKDIADDDFPDETASRDTVRRGMENLVVDWTRVSFVDGEKGKLFYRGIDIAELVSQSTYEECIYLLVLGRLPTRAQLDALTWKLGHLSRPPDRILRILKELPRTADPLSALQVAFSALTSLDQGDRLAHKENLLESALRVIALAPVIIASAFRHTQALPAITPMPKLNPVENFLYMLTGELPSKTTSRFLEMAMIVQMDHGFNPSTFTARAVSSTLSNVYAAVSAAVGALSGPLHGGASTRALDMIEQLRAEPNLEESIRSRINQGERIMGMGHRLYQKKDPRARILQDVVKQMASVGREAAQEDHDFLRAIEKAARSEFKVRGKPVYVNIDFWTGTLYKHLGLPRTLYPAIFAAARVTGWSAHVLELRQANKLYRPLSEYRGDLGVPYTAIQERKPLT